MCPQAAYLWSRFSHRRAMKRNARLRCPFRKGTCEITRKTRRQCQACRLRKCLESGMRKESEWRGCWRRGLWAGACMPARRMVWGVYEHLCTGHMLAHGLCATGRLVERSLQPLFLHPMARPEGPDRCGASLLGSGKCGEPWPGSCPLSPRVPLHDSFCPLHNCPYGVLAEWRK